MKIQEAIGLHLDTKQKFKRPVLLPMKLKGTNFYFNNPGSTDDMEYYVDVDDICATDWAMVEERISLSKAEIKIALARNGYITDSNPYLKDFISSLGFTE